MNTVRQTFASVISRGTRDSAFKSLCIRCTDLIIKKKFAPVSRQKNLRTLRNCWLLTGRRKFANLIIARFYAIRAEVVARVVKPRTVELMYLSWRVHIPLEGAGLLFILFSKIPLEENELPQKSRYIFCSVLSLHTVKIGPGNLSLNLPLVPIITADGDWSRGV